MIGRNTAFGFALVLVGLLAGAPAHAGSGSVEIKIYKAGFVVGVSGGSGTLTYAGRRYPLNIGGVSLGATVGASKTELIGRAYNLTRPSDLEGVYTAAEVGAAVAGGGKIAKLKNSHGVVLEVKGRQVGLMFSLDLSGMQISLKR
ncbi:hypothetical protein GCM10007036_07880 [Alsobacter metallidurans]|uniref:DUF1134 domain-containing protein n=1 Tax=Alsobacter metallidurans TaxID=340221 RepID=A0A917I3P4_9HYPH|nr:hypothetical protein [Alsobacter metallidurans]GGH11052.1 hypothetical protein GCM10007036_07880 [Alsobacter metallidurans]